MLKKIFIIFSISSIYLLAEPYATFRLGYDFNSYKSPSFSNNSKANLNGTFIGAEFGAYINGRLRANVSYDKKLEVKDNKNISDVKDSMSILAVGGDMLIPLVQDLYTYYGVKIGTSLHNITIDNAGYKFTTDEYGLIFGGRVGVSVSIKRMLIEGNIGYLYDTVKPNKARLHHHMNMGLNVGYKF